MPALLSQVSIVAIGCTKKCLQSQTANKMARSMQVLYIKWCKIIRYAIRGVEKAGGIIGGGTPRRRAALLGVLTPGHLVRCPGRLSSPLGPTSLAPASSSNTLAMAILLPSPPPPTTTTVAFYDLTSAL